MATIYNQNQKFREGEGCMKVDRLVSMIMILLEKRRVGAQELAAMFEVSPRTVYRDMEAINQAGIPVRSVPGVGGGFEIMPGYKVDRKAFSADDLSALLMGLNSLSGVMRGDEYTHALAKVRSFIPAEQARAIELKASQVVIDPRPWMGGGHVVQHLDTIKEALQQSRLLAFTYTDGHGNRTERMIEPYQLVLKSSHWYVHAFCRSRNDFRLFRLSRMSDLRILDEMFVPRDCPKPTLEFDELVETLQTDIRLRVHASVLDRVLDFCPPERVMPDGAEHYLVDYPFIERDYYYDMLLSLGDKCECLAPEHVRDEFRRRIQRMARIYGE